MLNRFVRKPFKGQSPLQILLILSLPLFIFLFLIKAVRTRGFKIGNNFEVERSLTIQITTPCRKDRKDYNCKNCENKGSWLDPIWDCRGCSNQELTR